MKIAFVTYNTLYQRTGGLQAQIFETKAALESRGHLVNIFNENNELLSDYDIVHVFAIAHGNYIWVRECLKQQVPFVVSPVIQSLKGRTDYLKLKIFESIADLILSGTPLASVVYSMMSVKHALKSSGTLIAQTKLESESIAKAFGVNPSNIRIVPNGVSDLFTFSPNIVKSRYIFIPGSIYPHKNQLVVVQVACELGLEVRLVGEILDQSYFDQINSYPNVKYLGVLERHSPDLIRLYQEATVTVLLSHGETFGLVLLESLACGTPVIFTNKTSFTEVNDPNCVVYISPNDKKKLAYELNRFFSSPVDGLVVSQVSKDYSWSAIGGFLEEIYLSQLKSQDK